MSDPEGRPGFSPVQDLQIPLGPVTPNTYMLAMASSITVTNMRTSESITGLEAPSYFAQPYVIANAPLPNSSLALLALILCVTVSLITRRRGLSDATR